MQDEVLGGRLHLCLHASLVSETLGSARLPGGGAVPLPEMRAGRGGCSALGLAWMSCSSRLFCVRARRAHRSDDDESLSVRKGETTMEKECSDDDVWRLSLALRYVQAFEAGDFERLSALFDLALGHPDLEDVLCATAEALAAEEIEAVQRSPELQGRLRDLVAHWSEREEAPRERAGG